jgi:uncharacterized membrane protein YjfL (UPF0719 family)
MGYLKFVLIQYLVTIGWGIAGAIAMGIGLGIALMVFNKMTPRIDEIEELKKGNLGVAIILAAVILATGIVVAVTVMPTVAK